MRPRPASLSAASINCRRTASERFGAGAISIIFWCLRCTLQSRSPKWQTAPEPSPPPKDAADQGFKDLAAEWMEIEGLKVQTLKLKDAERQEGALIDDPSISKSWRTYHLQQSDLRTVHRPCHLQEPKGRRKLPGEDDE